jgi:hypothetical protein
VSRRLVLAAAIVASVGAFLPEPAWALGGNYRFDGGSTRQRALVNSALAASQFDWDVVPRQVTIHFARGVDTHALPGEIWIDTDLLTAGVFSWAVVQDEYAHQVDFLLLDEDARARLNVALGGKVWCHTEVPGLRHGDYGCERFSSTLVWSYWPSKLNSYRPQRRGDESAALAPKAFRALVEGVVSERLSMLAAVR